MGESTISDFYSGDVFWNNSAVNFTTLPKKLTKLLKGNFYNCANIRIDTFGEDGSGLTSIGD